MNNIIEIENIAELIHQIRGKKVMLDRDLANLYEVETKRLKEQVRRNISRFPEDFMFELTANEHQNLRSQNATSSWGGSRYAPMAFTEHGVLMLSSVLNSERAIQINIQIVRVFNRLRQLIFDQTEIRKEIENLKAETEGRFRIVFETLDQLISVDSTPRKKIGFTAKERQTEYQRQPGE
jgi:phage regulator Rha-like protein